jgi:hypothetical protein
MLNGISAAEYREWFASLFERALELKVKLMLSYRYRYEMVNFEPGTTFDLASMNTATRIPASMLW